MAHAVVYRQKKPPLRFPDKLECNDGCAVIPRSLSPMRRNTILAIHHMKSLGGKKIIRDSVLWAACFTSSGAEIKTLRLLCAHKINPIYASHNANVLRFNIGSTKKVSSTIGHDRLGLDPFGILPGNSIFLRLLCGCFCTSQRAAAR